MPAWLIPAALSAANLLGSLLNKKPNTPGIPPEYQTAINDLLKRTKTGISPEAMRAYLQQGKTAIGQESALAKEAINRNLARQGLEGSSVGNTMAMDVYQKAQLAQSGLTNKMALLNEQAKQQAYSDLLRALGGETYAAGQKFYAEKSLMPDWGSGLGYSLAALMNNPEFLKMLKLS